MTPTLDAMNHRQLRVALLVDGLHQTAWVASALRQALAEGTIAICNIYVNADPDLQQRKVSFRIRLAALKRNRNLLAYALYRRIDARRSLYADDPLRLVEVNDVLA